MKNKHLSLTIMGILLLSLLSGCSSQSSVPARTVGTAVDGNELNIEAASIKLANGVVEGGYALISTEDLKKMIDEKQDMIIVDTMPADSFAKGHIPGAVNAELPKTGLKDATDEQKSAFVKVLGEDKNKKIIVYCGFVACARSHAGAILAKENGFANVLRQPGGIIAWKDAKYDVEK
jgi:thiosulfate/3-mercaptopyruvate sulfurtransferase